jgi:hypothetical protein
MVSGLIFFIMIYLFAGRAFSLFGETGMANGKPIPKKKSSIGVKASAAEAGKYTREAGVLAYYEVNDCCF